MAAAAAPAVEPAAAAGARSGGAAKRAAPDSDAAPSSSGRGDAPTLIHKGVAYRQYKDEGDLPQLMELIDKDLSEPYSIFTYRYFLAQLCFLAHDADTGAACGVVVCKMDVHRGKQLRGYLAMLVVDKAYRGKGIGSKLARMAIQAMIDGGAEEVALEAEVTNTGALALYRALGFIRDKRLHRYYLSGNDAYRLKLQLPLTERYHERLQRERDSIYGVPEDMGAAGSGGTGGGSAYAGEVA